VQRQARVDLFCCFFIELISPERLRLKLESKRLCFSCELCLSFHRVLSEIRSEVTRKVGIFWRPRITQISRIQAEFAKDRTFAGFGVASTLSARPTSMSSRSGDRYAAQTKAATR